MAKNLSKTNPNYFKILKIQLEIITELFELLIVAYNWLLTTINPIDCRS